MRLLILLSLLLTACVAKPPVDTVDITTVEAELDESVWQLNKATCSLSATRADITISTDGTLSNNMIYAKIVSSIPTEGDIQLALTSWPYTFRLNGGAGTWSTEVPYDPAVVNRLMHSQSFLAVRYTPARIDGAAQKSRYAYFPTHSLPTAMAQLSHCS